jgi:hypothetical protein
VLTRHFMCRRRNDYQRIHALSIDTSAIRLSTLASCDVAAEAIAPALPRHQLAIVAVDSLVRERTAPPQSSDEARALAPWINPPSP